ncbi:hypothetical protein NPIL_288791 [Nephila pilipes]|uniref:Uncharacterized protein n=1 Tax=Nephila pilipes TaxID=299642 RepID=A0A8X6UPQ0_NEPPI|nr:hypothetical protein NPIL_288791 [Nephila pilipes]
MDVFWPPLQLLSYTRAARWILCTFDSKPLLHGDYNIEQVKEKVSTIRFPTALDWKQITINARGYEFCMANRKGIPYFLTRLQD